VALLVLVALLLLPEDDDDDDSLCLKFGTCDSYLLPLLESDEADDPPCCALSTVAAAASRSIQYMQSACRHSMTLCSTMLCPIFLRLYLITIEKQPMT
jgi:hypothetical protein